ncbi:imidazole glycerol phosphate synthase subunit HisF [Fluviispira vulneris]|uniref:imidazole glycerol phosphate synthase subunit HisF n=1 Tax=Fluviispira vulneris TaxID=2763012 RepID=UPI001645FE1D|nr:imidazole glycerol phosphate synthase cyclase subunit [Fluviispira vulneris]
MTLRIIAKLDIKGPNLVKGIQLEGLRVLGDPILFAQNYYEQGIDEILYIDVVASLYNRNSLHDLIEKTSKKSFIPLTVGGGIRNLEDIKAVLRVGADKVCINTAAINDPTFIEKAALKFGSSTITIAIEVIKQANQNYLVYTNNGREYTGIDAFEWAKTVEKLGAGEILLTSIDREGTGTGFDCELISKFVNAVGIPVIAHGGAGQLSQIVECAKKTHVNAIALASIIHYDLVHELFKEYTQKSEGNLQFLKNKEIPKYIKPSNIFEIKNALLDESIICRPCF